MKIVHEYSHLGGSEILTVKYPAIRQEILDVIGAVEAKRVKESKEKTKQGKLLYAPIEMNREFKSHFYGKGYKELKDTYTITIPDSSVKITVRINRSISSKSVSWLKFSWVSTHLCFMTWLSFNTSLTKIWQKLAWKLFLLIRSLAKCPVAFHMVSN